MKEILTQGAFSVYHYTLFDAVTDNTGISLMETVSPQLPYRTFYAALTTGTTATVEIQVSGDGENFMTLAILNPLADEPDGFADLCPWPYVRAEIFSNNGTLSVTMGC